MRESGWGGGTPTTQPPGMSPLVFGADRADCLGQLGRQHDATPSTPTTEREDNETMGEMAGAVVLPPPGEQVRALHVFPFFHPDDAQSPDL